MAATTKPTTDATADFFEGLGAHGHEPLLRKAQGSTKFEIVDGRRVHHWLVTIDRGDIAVSRRNAAADCTIRADKALFDKIATGRLNAVAAVLRGDLAVEGDWRLLVRMQRLFPGSPRSRRRKHSAAGYARRRK